MVEKDAIDLLRSVLVWHSVSTKLNKSVQLKLLVKSCCYWELIHSLQTESHVTNT